MKIIIIITMGVQIAALTTLPAEEVMLQHSLRAFTIYDKDGNHWQIIDPPEQWFERPAPKNINIKIVPDGEASNYCKDAKETTKGTIKKVVGCAIKDPKRPDDCDIFVDGSLIAQSRIVVIHHEQAHCHGWPQYHPTGEILPIPRPNPIGTLRKQEAKNQK